MDDQPPIEQHHQQLLTLPCICYCKLAMEVQEEPKQISEPNWLSEKEEALINQ